MARLCPESRRSLLRLGVQSYYGPGQFLMRQGGEGSSVYLLRSRDTTVSACVKITDADGQLFAIRVSGDVIGELAALDPGSVRSATASVCTATIAHCIPGDAFVAFLDGHTDGWQVLCRTIADRLAWSDQRRLDFGERPVHVRLARLLVEFAESHGRRTKLVREPSGPEIEVREMTVRLSYKELGNLIGARVDAVGRAMTTMRAADLACLQNGHVVVLDLEGLREFAGLT
ncbi:Crp/Fnr family transcriptional regulator [Nocardia crassostreae]|uniref:Crp/Fnr family transcriptional regulator n=1 Tax=Nocardia crassostreae TaxID=53428 RepID=UPI000AAD2BCE|nr:Crp/Fnr family transcriptional regulator [Nocardia crassostreae]